MQKNPHLLIEGIIIARLRDRRQQVVHLHPRRVRPPGRRARRGARRGPRGGLRRRAHPRLRPLARPRRAPRRRRLHLRRGDRAARLARGQARQPAPEAAVPGRPGPLPGPDADQQRRDADERPDRSCGWAARSTRRSARRPRPARRSSRSRAASSGPGNYEIELGIPSREIIYDLAGGPPEGRKVKAWFPGGSSAPVLPGTDEYLDLPYDFDSMAKAGSMLGSGAIIVVDDSVSIVDVALKTAKFYRHESCGKCTPCREGTNWTVKMLERDRDRARRRRWTSTSWPRSSDQIIGNCLCVLGDAMAMPIGSMIKHFRAEFEAHIEAARERNGLGVAIPQVNRGRNAGPARCASPPAPTRPRWRSDAAPRGRRWSRSRSTAARSRRPRTRCSSTGPSTATSRSPSSATSPSSASRSARAACAWSRSRASRSSRPRARRRSRTAWSSTRRPSACTSAQRAVVEFLLINHPLDCPVCDKGGECPLQDITYGWGPGTSRFIEPKRHFRKPLELSPLIAIDRERCILCYRCVRFSQEISEDYQLILLERGAHSYVGTFDGHPYVAPFSGNIIELCPVGALTSRAYRFRARPWDIEGAGTVCTLCPAQCNVELTVRDDRVHARARARPRRRRRRLAVRQGPLRLPVRPRRRAASRSRSCARARAACRRPGRRRSTRRRAR